MNDMLGASISRSEAEVLVLNDVPKASRQTAMGIREYGSDEGIRKFPSFRIYFI